MKILILHALRSRDGAEFQLRHNFDGLSDDVFEIARAGIASAEGRLGQVSSLSLLVKTDDISVPCENCAGTGTDLKTPFDKACHICAGTGRVLESEPEK